MLSIQELFQFSKEEKIQQSESIAANEIADTFVRVLRNEEWATRKITIKYEFLGQIIQFPYPSSYKWCQP